MKSDEAVFSVQILGDNFSRQFIYHARPLIDNFGLRGEKAVREGVRRYGRERGHALRMQHLKQGFKINLNTIFGGHYDLPADPRVDKNTLVLNEQVRRALVFACPIADVWADMGATEIGRIYCEEFHHAMWGTYASGAQINLTQTLTQEGDDRCNFSVYQRPANIESPELLAEAFPEYDLDWKEGNVSSSSAKRTAREAYEDLCIRLFHAMDSTALEVLGSSEEVCGLLSVSAGEMAKDFAAHIIRALLEEEEPVDPVNVARYSPFGTREQSVKAWHRYAYEDSRPSFIMEESFFPAFEQTIESAVKDR